MVYVHTEMWCVCLSLIWYSVSVRCGEEGKMDIIDGII